MMTCRRDSFNRQFAESAFRSTLFSIWFGALIAISAFLAASLSADEPAKFDFDRDVRPLFATHCWKCHGELKQHGGLRLDEKQAALNGGDSGRVIVPGKSAESVLIQRVSSSGTSERMPPEGKPLSVKEVEILKQWIDRGATWSESHPVVAKETHWSFRPVVKPTPPMLAANSKTAVPTQPPVTNEIDAFVIAKLAESGLALSPEANRRTLVRRIYFDLVGLPPSPEEVNAFLSDASPHAYENLVEKLLNSPRHGERWASHWLDVVRFAESDGFETNKPRANAWPYRDYVIAAFNNDKPFDRFIIEQLAGDVLGENAATGFLVGGANDVVRSPDPVLTAQQRADVLHDMVSTTSSAFLGLTVGCARCHNHKFDPIPQADYYAMKAALAGVDHGERELSKNVDSSSLKQLELARAELLRVNSELNRYEKIARQQSPGKLDARTQREPVNARLNVDRFTPVLAKRLRFTVNSTNNGEPCIDELEVFSADADSKNVALAENGTIARSSSNFASSPLHKLEHINDGKFGNSRSWISAERGKGWVELEFPAPLKIQSVAWARDREEKYADRLATDYAIEVANSADDWKTVATSRDRAPFAGGKSPMKAFSTESLRGDDKRQADELLKSREKLEAEIKKLSTGRMVYAGRFAPNPGATVRFHRGDPMQPRETIEPGSLRAIPVKFSFTSLAPLTPASRSTQTEILTADQQRRLALAQWITDSANPLTPRVIVNRLWQQHFGEGFVSTSSDFGANGTRPTHVELLDWLAAELVEHGWSLRHLHRLIVLSATYKQSSAMRPEAAVKDASARLLWRYPPRRLEAEPIRDSILSVSGKLDLSMGGPGFSAFEANNNYVRVYNAKQSFGPADWRRMIYMTKIRMQQDGTFGAFDCPDGGQIAPKRNRSTTPLQALNLLNSPFLLQQANLFAERLVKEAGKSPVDQVRRAFQLAYQREPETEELDACVQLVNQHGLPILGRALMNSNEFLFVY